VIAIPTSVDGVKEFYVTSKLLVLNTQSIEGERTGRSTMTITAWPGGRTCSGVGLPMAIDCARAAALKERTDTRTVWHFMTSRGVSVSALS
jgi:hypothetical protein